MSTIKAGKIQPPNDSDSLQIFTNAVERMRVTSDGLVGIGTASPLAPLHVSDLSAEIRITAPSITGADWGILPQTNNNTPLFRIFDRYNSLNRLTISSAGLVTATSFAGNGTIPIGGIIMWSGSTIPTGWAFCDGTTVSGILTPNLTNKFIISRSAGTVTTTTVTGADTSTGGSTIIPNHKHFLARHTVNDDAAFNASLETDAILDAIPSDGYRLVINGNGSNGVQAINAFTTPDSLYGLVTSKSIVDQETVNLPPYYALAFIMRVA